MIFSSHSTSITLKWELGVSPPPLKPGFRGGSSSCQDKITSKSPKVFGKSSEGLKCSKLSTKKVARWSYEFKYEFLKNQKNRFSKKWRFFSVFQKKNEHFLEQKVIFIVCTILQWLIHIVYNICPKNHSSVIVEHIFIQLVNIWSTLSIIWSTLFITSIYLTQI